MTDLHEKELLHSNKPQIDFFMPLGTSLQTSLPPHL